MFTITGEYNSADIMIDDVDDATLKQIYGFLNHPAFTGEIVIMPDCHAGAGSCIGFTMTMGDMIIPNVVGVDIGCGMLAYRLCERELDFSELDRVIREYVPHGFDIFPDTDVADAYLDCSSLRSFREVVLEMAGRVEQRSGKALESLGTLGGGNHFIEVDKADNGELWLVVHSGSRNLGLCVAQYHQKKAREYMNEKYNADAYRYMEYLEGDGMEQYLKDMQTAQVYANINRELIMSSIHKHMGLHADDCIQCIHNYINFDDGIIRKGAISAQAGERVVIPLNMRDGVVIGRGRGNPDWNFSAPHGAGRTMSRKQAKKVLDLEEYRREMEGVWSSCISHKTLDEAPMAYKDPESIMNVLGETIAIDLIMKPVYNFKAD
jgi:tRNA-splicing ligase RtcB